VTGKHRSVEGRPLDDADLIDRARQGDVRAYEELVERYREIAFRTAYLIARNAADAQDAAQEAFVKAYFALPRFRQDSPLRPWLLRIVANEARNRRRSAGRRERLALRVAAEPSSGDVSAPSPEAEVLSREERAALLAAVERLPERLRVVVACRYFLGMSEAETAAALGLRAGTVKSRAHRSLARLRSEIAGTPAARSAEEDD
jgi:RNA polymerase sigma-70 factor (ECF subfamily)